ncbi:NAD(P)-binding protein [Candidatus Saccharibacteria bacterium]|nr:NAD(P)-binding protein [Candidatus Saccharibacteria bacterium]
MEKKTVKNLIIGAGLSGISCAYYLKDDYLVLEQEKTPGGYCRTIPNDKYVWDFAGHFYHFRTEKYKKLFTDLVDENQIVEQKKNTKIFYKNKLVDYPFQANIHELCKEEFIQCLYDLYFRDGKSDYDNFLDMLYAKFGKSITEKFLRPYNEKLYAVDLHELDKDAMGRFFPYVDFEEVIGSMGNKAKETYNDEFLYLKKGTGYFIDRLFEKIDGNRVELGNGVKKINRKEKFVETVSGEIIYYENLINTVPFNAFLAMLGEAEQDEKIASLSYNKVLVFNLGFDKPSPKYKKEHWVYFPEKKFNFYRIGFYNNILKRDQLNVYVEIGFPKDAGEINEEEELAKALKGMEEAGIIDEELALVDKNILLMDPAYVHIKEEDKIKEYMKDFEKDNIYMLGRYGRWTYNSMEDCIQLADELAARLS